MRDLFISHASEDKDDFVRPLAIELQSQGFSVWYDEFELKLGDSLSESIDNGLSISEYGIVVLSDNFFNKKWTKRELSGLVAKEIDSKKTILPIWHKVSKQDVLEFSPTLADKLAVNSEKGIDKIILEIKKVFGDRKKKSEIELAQEYFANGDYTAAILKNAVYLEQWLREKLIKTLGYKYFKKPPLHAIGMRGLLKIGEDKSIIKSTHYEYGKVNTGRLCKMRNEVVHSQRTPNIEDAKWFIDEVDLLIKMNR